MSMLMRDNEMYDISHVPSYTVGTESDYPLSTVYSQASLNIRAV